MTAEYIIGVKKDGEVTHVANVDLKTGEASLSRATPSGFKYATKFKVKARAEKFAKKIVDSELIPYYGGIVTSTKSTVAPIQSKINKHSPYRS